jgi:hypothetical protein
VPQDYTKLESWGLRCVYPPPLLRWLALVIDKPDGFRLGRSGPIPVNDGRHRLCRSADGAVGGSGSLGIGEWNGFRLMMAATSSREPPWLSRLYWLNCQVGDIGGEFVEFYIRVSSFTAGEGLKCNTLSALLSCTVFFFRGCVRFPVVGASRKPCMSVYVCYVCM